MPVDVAPSLRLPGCAAAGSFGSSRHVHTRDNSGLLPQPGRGGISLPVLPLHWPATVMIFDINLPFCYITWAAVSKPDRLCGSSSGSTN